MICVVCQRDVDHDVRSQVCERCEARMVHGLREIPDLCAELASLGYVERDLREVAGRPADPVAYALTAGPLNGASAAPHVSGSATPPVPVRVDVVDLLAAARPASVKVKLRGDWWLVPGGDPDQIGDLSAATELLIVARDWASLRCETEPVPDVMSLCRWLTDRLPWAVQDHPAVDEFAILVRWLRWWLRAQCGHLPARNPPRDGRCPRCGLLSLVLGMDSGYTECGNPECGAMLTEDDYRAHLRVLIEQAHTPETPKEAA